MRYSLSSIKVGLTQPRKIITEINGYFRNGRQHNTNSCCNNSGYDITEEDWDNIILLDACRFDVFSTVGDTLPGKLKKRESQAGDTREFLRHNFRDQEFLDTVYITANPMLYRSQDEVNVKFHKIFNVWQDNWADDLRTVKPDVVTEKTLQVAKKYTNKRLIIHYLQPHAPYIGPTGQDLPTDYLNFWNSWKRGEFSVSFETVEQAYRENVEIMIPHIKTLLNNLIGKTIITADHAELLGERDVPIPIARYGHGEHTYLDKLVEVPWLVHQNGNRKSIQSENKIQDNRHKVSEQKVNDRLADLGYLN